PGVVFLIRYVHPGRSIEVLDRVGRWFAVRVAAGTERLVVVEVDAHVVDPARPAEIDRQPVLGVRRTEVTPDRVGRDVRAAIRDHGQAADGGAVDRVGRVG